MWVPRAAAAAAAWRRGVTPHFQRGLSTAAPPAASTAVPKQPQVGRHAGDADEEDDYVPRPPSFPAPVTRFADMRSDTVTVPTPQMVVAMIDAAAYVADDVYGECPVMAKLEREGAAYLGKPAALWLPSGTQANLVAVGVHCGRRGDELVAGDESHIVAYEQGGVAQLLGVAMHTLVNRPDGTIALTGGRGSLAALLASRDRGADIHSPRPACVALENTHNRCGGVPLPAGYVDDAAALAHEYGAALHVDGARLANAAAVLGTPAARLAAAADSVSLCLSKGLGAPAGSLLAGSPEFVTAARRLRKAVGGGMRQAGLLAAAGSIALKEHAGRLGVDHARAKSLARGLAALRGVVLDPRAVLTNIVFFDLDAQLLDAAHARTRGVGAGEGAAMADGTDPRLATLALPPDADAADVFVAVLAALGRVKVGKYGTRRIRAVTHHQVGDADIERALDAATEAVRLLSKP
jgi:threonine aldolase